MWQCLCKKLNVSTKPALSAPITIFQVRFYPSLRFSGYLEKKTLNNFSIGYFESKIKLAPLVVERDAPVCKTGRNDMFSFFI